MLWLNVKYHFNINMEAITNPIMNAFSGVKGEIEGSVPQIAILNNLLPRGFRFEPFENIKKGDNSHSRSEGHKDVIFRMTIVIKEIRSTHRCRI